MNRKYKPYDIVVVQAKGYSHYGEVVSLEIPQPGGAPPTYKVRCVPGEPGTMREIAIDALSFPDSARKTYDVHYAIVASRFKSRPLHGFPVDMLRYDFAAPLNFKLVEQPHIGSMDCEIDPTFGFDDLVIAAATRRSGGAWTPERWESFMWSIKPLKTLRLVR